MSTRNSAVSGLVLSELIVVIIVIGIIGAMIFLVFPDNEEERLSNALSALQSDLRYVRSVAMSESTNAEIFFSIQNNCYYIRKKQPNGMVTTIRTAKPDGVKLVSVNASANTVSYNPRGTTADACTITMETNKFIGRLTVNVGAGRVKITEITKK